MNSANQPLQDRSDALLHLLRCSAPPQLSVSSYSLQVVQSIQLFGIKVDDQLNRKQHVSNIIRGTLNRIYMLRRLRSMGTPAAELKGVYTSFILHRFIHGPPAPTLALLSEPCLHNKVILSPACIDYNNAVSTLTLSRLSPSHQPSPPPRDGPPPVHATRHQNNLIPIKAPKTNRYQHIAIPTIVRA